MWVWISSTWIGGVECHAWRLISDTTKKVPLPPRIWTIS